LASIEKERRACSDLLTLLAALVDSTAPTFVPAPLNCSNASATADAVSATLLMDAFQEQGAAADPFRLVAALANQRAQAQ
jgi:hypothetical protein